MLEKKRVRTFSFLPPNPYDKRNTMKRPLKLQIVTFPAAKVRIRCPIHGVVKIQSAYDPFLKKMTAISCAKCPTVLTPTPADAGKEK